jgi:hypothetical protein
MRSSLHHLREAVHDHVLANTLFPDADSQRSKQARAVREHEAGERERREYLDSLQIKQPNESRATAPARLKPISQPKRVSRVAAARAQQRATHKEDKL